MRDRSDSISAGTPLPALSGKVVSIFVEDSHPLLLLKAALDWQAITEVMVKHWRAAGKNVDCGKGLPWPVRLYVPLLILMMVKCLNSRQTEEFISENVVARLFLGVEEKLLAHIRDHSNIARAVLGLSEEGFQQVNHLIVKQALGLGFGKPAILSSDTTVQEPAIGYPNEAGILRGAAQRIKRALRKIKSKAKEKLPQVEEALEKAKEVLRSVKEYHLFAKGKEAKDEVLRKIITQSEELMSKSEEVIEKLGTTSSRVVKAGVEKIKQVAQVVAILIPQINYWMESGEVAKEKILHVAITEARAIVKNKAGKKVEFGLKWLINRLEGGYVFGEVVEAHSDERKMPLLALKGYREVFGEEATPEMEVYDRGGSSAGTIKELEKEGVKKIGIEPKGKASWRVAEEDQREVKRQRAMSEGSIGTLKSNKYGFNHRRERSNESLRAAGQMVLVRVNLNKLMREIEEKERQERQAETRG